MPLMMTLSREVGYLGHSEGITGSARYLRVLCQQGLPNLARSLEKCCPDSLH